MPESYARTHAGNEVWTVTSFEERLESVYADALRFARGLAGSAADGDALLQDALARAWRGYPRLRDPERFRAL